MGCSYFLFAYLGYDMIFVQVCTFIVMRFEIMSLYASKIGKSFDDFKEHNLLISLSKTHEEMLSYIKLCNSFYNLNSLIVNVLCTSLLCACVVAFQLVSGFVFLFSLIFIFRKYSNVKIGFFTRVQIFSNQDVVFRKL